MLGGVDTNFEKKVRHTFRGSEASQTNVQRKVNKCSKEGKNNVERFFIKKKFCVKKVRQFFGGKLGKCSEKVRQIFTEDETNVQRKVTVDKCSEEGQTNIFGEGQTNIERKARQYC